MKHLATLNRWIEKPWARAAFFGLLCWLVGASCSIIKGAAAVGNEYGAHVTDDAAKWKSSDEKWIVQQRHNDTLAQGIDRVESKLDKMEGKMDLLLDLQRGAKRVAADLRQPLYLSTDAKR